MGNPATREWSGIRKAKEKKEKPKKVRDMTPLERAERREAYQLEAAERQRVWRLHNPQKYEAMKQRKKEKYSAARAAYRRTMVCPLCLEEHTTTHSKALYCSKVCTDYAAAAEYAFSKLHTQSVEDYAYNPKLRPGAEAIQANEWGKPA